MSQTKPLCWSIWKLLATFLLYLSYLTEGRTYVELNCGIYVAGLVDGVVLSLSLFAVALYFGEIKKDN